MPITPGRDALERGKRGVERALEVIADDLHTHAVNAAPILTGDLRRSGRVGDVVGFERNGGREANVEVSFGGFVPGTDRRVRYAAIVHEGIHVVEAPIHMAVRPYRRRPPGAPPGARKTVRVRGHTRVLQAQVIKLNPPRTGKRKFLEDELKAHAPRYEDIIGAAWEAGVSSRG